MSEVQAETAEQIARLRVLWPVLNSRPEHTQEIVKAVIRHEHKLSVADVTVGFSNAIENAPTTGWPPGPHEVLGCIIKAAEVRKATSATVTTRRHTGGLTFAEWWSSLPEDERPKHKALHRIMRGTDPDEPELAEVEQPVPLTPMPVPDDDEGDDIEWGDAA